MALTQLSEVRPQSFYTSWVATDGTASKQVWNNGDGYHRCDALWWSNNDTADHVVDLFVDADNNGGSYVGSFTVPHGSGVTAPLYEAVKGLFGAALALPAQSAGQGISAAPHVAVGGSATLTCYAAGGWL